MSHFQQNFVFNPWLLQSFRWDSKPWPHLHMTLAVGEILNTNSLKQNFISECQKLFSDFQHTLIVLNCMKWSPFLAIENIDFCYWLTLLASGHICCLQQWIIIQQFTRWSCFISILTHNKRRKHIWSLQLLPTIRHCTEELPPILRLHRICLRIFVTPFKRKNDVTQSSAMNDVIFQ